MQKTEFGNLQQLVRRDYDAMKSKPSRPDPKRIAKRRAAAKAARKARKGRGR